MSRKKSGFAITSVRGGSGAAPGDASGTAASGSSPSSSSSSSGSPSGSRFRLVRLLSPGEVLRRGRWLCRDFYERDASPRGGGGGGGRVPASLDAPRALPAPHQPRSLGAFAQLVQQVRGRGLRGAGPLDHTHLFETPPHFALFVYFPGAAPQTPLATPRGRGRAQRAPGIGWRGERGRGVRRDFRCPGLPVWVGGTSGLSVGVAFKVRGRGAGSPPPHTPQKRGRKPPLPHPFQLSGAGWGRGGVRLSV